MKDYKTLEGKLLGVQFKLESAEQATLKLQRLVNKHKDANERMAQRLEDLGEKDAI
jgi:hypothetical protein